MGKRRPQLREPQKIESDQEYDRTKVFYGRVSTLDQSLDVQIAYADREHIHPENRFVEKISAKASRRPQYGLMMKFLQPGDTLYVWALSRLARDTKDLLQINEDLLKMGVSLVSGTEPIDTRTADGKLMFTMRAAFAQFERDKTIERTRAGLQTRKEAGATLGAKPKMSPEHIHQAKLDLAKPGAKMPAVAEKYGVTPPTLHKHTGGIAESIRYAKRFAKRKTRKRRK